MERKLRLKLLLKGLGKKNVVILIAIIAIFFSSLIFSLGVVNSSSNELNKFAVNKRVNSFKIKGGMNPEVFETERIGIKDLFLVPFSRNGPSLGDLKVLKSKLNGKIAPRKILIWNKVSKNEFRNVYIHGIVPSREIEVSELNLKRGEFIEKRGEALIDSKNAEILELNLNDTLKIKGGFTRKNHRIEPRNITLKVVGILNYTDIFMAPNSLVRASKLNKSSPLAESGIFMHIEDALKLSKSKEISEIAVKSENYKTALKNLEEIRKLERNFTVKEEITTYKYLTKDFRIFLNSFAFLVIGISVIVSALTSGLISLVIEKKVEDFKTLKVLGFKERTLLIYLFSVPIIIVTSGAFIGSIIGLYLSQKPVVIPSLFTNIGYILPSLGRSEHFILALIYSFILLTSLFPAFKLRKKFLGD